MADGRRGQSGGAGDAAPVDEGDGASSRLLHLILEESEAGAAPRRIDGLLTGTLLRIEGGLPLVGFAGSPAAGTPARAVVDLGPGEAGRAVALMFDGGDPRLPVVMGVLRDARDEEASGPDDVADGLALDAAPAGAPSPFTVAVDGEAVVLSVERELVLRCGKASITLRRDGHVLIRGAYVLSRSTGVNRIKGGSVQIN